MSLIKDIANATTCSFEVKYPFAFKQVEKEYESYRGSKYDVRYYVRVTITRSMFSVVKDQEFWVQCAQNPPEDMVDKGMNAEVGLEKIVLLSLRFENALLDLTDGVVLGKLKFYLVQSKIERAEIMVVRKETSGKGENEQTIQEVLHTFEIIDGTPFKDEVVPVRLYLKAIDESKLNCTLTHPNCKFSVRYYVHLSLLDRNNNRYFKQKEIHLWRSQNEDEKIKSV